MACSRDKDTVDASSNLPSVSIVSPKQGVILDEGTVDIKVKIENFELAPLAIGLTKKNGVGHWHVYLNGDWVAAAGQNSYFLEGIPPGAHHLEVALANNDHSPVTPSINDFIILQVEADETEIDGELAGSTNEEESNLPDMDASSHFVSSTPAHGDTLNQPPDSITVVFDFNLAPESSIEITKYDEVVVAGPLEIAPDKFSMSVPVEGHLGNGVYKVSYLACWPYLNCHNGSFAYIVDAR